MKWRKFPDERPDEDKELLVAFKYDLRAGKNIYKLVSVPTQYTIAEYHNEKNILFDLKKLEYISPEDKNIIYWTEIKEPDESRSTDKTEPQG
jgi:phosphoribosylaminoimidazole-succinocarboxamide synthase